MPVIDFWHWWILAVILITAEILLPGFMAIWLAIAAFLTGLVMLLLPQLTWEWQLLVFAVWSVLSIVGWRYYYARRPIKTDEPLLNKRGEGYVGRVITLAQPIIDGEGKVRLDDSTWKVTGPDCPAGTKIRIVALNNVVFTVEKYVE
ncbi:Putative activity regulator of membrane protease YbbK [Methylophaga frappieri]|uniref:Putative activity regulator of membrane protease YbbK n=1 Tax=Methylophaga frappieri (strain ATCC BAA-2434 / DSM 25690 / JAM7) TaxID=754477 RepID=I1YFW1_METFJ|nr:NfeD family protein [Methylophaga frappieri]AFJ01804.1 Putative activity regulator of membrane protease YbbK [Methylophaga frappieri]